MLRLDSGNWLEKVDFGPDERILKIGIVHIPGYLKGAVLNLPIW